MDQGIYLNVQFNFPKPFQAEYGQKAKSLHQALEEQDWIDEICAASGGIGGSQSSMWVFKLGNYAALDRLFHGNDLTSRAYVNFFSAMDDVQDFIREEVNFT